MTVYTLYLTDSGTGIVTATFEPNNSLKGLGAGEVSNIMAFTSATAPAMGDTPNVSALYLSNYECPGGSTYIPLTIPEPSNFFLFITGLLSLSILKWRKLSLFQ